MLFAGDAMPDRFRRSTSTTNCSRLEGFDEQPDGAATGGHDQSPVQVITHADDRLTVWQAWLDRRFARRSHIGYLEALLLAEIEERERNTIERRIRKLIFRA